MYQYIWDAETGGLLLTNEQSKFSKEPRPVYYKELDILGFDKYWRYPKDESAPIMWAEANNYIYKGRTIARTKGGTLYCAPELIVLEDVDAELELVDIDEMVKKNLENLDVLLNYYEKIKDNLKELPKLLDGREIMKILQIQASPKLGTIINELKEAQIAGVVKTKDDAISFIRNLKV